MRLILVNPAFGRFVGAPSMGLGFLATHVRDRAGVPVEVYEPALQKMSEEDLLRRILSADGPLAVGFVCYTESRFTALDFAAKVKAARPDALVIAGGVHVNELDVLLLEKCPAVDVVVRGEGEDTLLELVTGRPYAAIAGITYREDGGIRRNPDRALRENIDDLGYDYSLLDPWIREWKDLEIPVRFQRMPHLPIIVSRGCKFRCSFCGAFDYWRHSYRAVSNEKIVARMKELAETRKIGYFRFYDALFLGGEEKRILDFCRIIKEQGLKVTFRIDLRIGTRPEVLKALREAGCIVVGFGVESASDRVLKRINKGITRRLIEETAEACRKLGFWSIGFFMISMPGEEIEDVRENFSIFHRFNELNLQFFKIHPGTPFYRELRERGEITDEVWFDRAKSDDEYFYCKETFASARLPRKTVEMMLMRYYLLPMKLWHYAGTTILHPVQTLMKVIYSLRLPLIGRIVR